MAQATLIQMVKPNSLKRYGDFARLTLEEFALKNNMLAIPTTTSVNIGRYGGKRSYNLFGSLALLEKALIKWTMNELVTKHNFNLAVVPNILYDHIIEKCGFPTNSTRSQVYKISGSVEDSIFTDNPPLSTNVNRKHTCLAGTSEFALASIHIGDTLTCDELPKRYCAKSRCYRAETSKLSNEGGLYRVNYFNKVEMFAFVEPSKSESTMLEFVEIQKQLFDQLELEYKVIDIPKEDLGLSAVKKYDIEAYMNGRQMFGEISSTSNCMDYQSSRLNIRCSKFVEQNSQLKVETNYLHTVNGTACAIPRMLIAIIETHQTKNGTVCIPKPLIEYMNGETELPTKDDKNKLKYLKYKTYEKHLDE